MEVGAGTGQLTTQLARSSADILALELRVNLAEVLRRNVARFPNVRVLVTDFDEWQPQGASFDLVVLATAFYPSRVTRDGTRRTIRHFARESWQI